jgi:macrolide-specific efflux system membrane fusion protein
VNIVWWLSGWRRAVVVAVVGLAAVGGWYLWRGGDESATSYRPVEVTRGDLDITVLSAGVVQPRNRLEIKPPIPGRVEQVLVQEGQSVVRGTVLAWMSSTERAALLDAARGKDADEVKRWEELYRATPILAPIDGTLILRNVEPGQSFTSNDAVFVMSDRLIVTAQVDETDIAQVRLKQAAQIELDAYPGQYVDGRVAQIAYDAKTVNNVTTYPVDVLPAKVPAFMRSGMTANVRFHVETRKGVLLVPSDALRSRDGQVFVLRPPARAGDAPLEQPVTTGQTDGKRTEVLSGVNEGEALLAAGLKTGGGNGKTNPFMPGGRR